MLKANAGGGFLLPSTFAMYPESAPFGRGLQGAPKVDWVAEWLPDVNLKRMISPILASIVFGVKTGAVSATT